MQIETVARAVFDSVDDYVKRSFNGTISKKIPLRNIGDWYREIDVNDDAKMLFLRTANQCMPLPFENISGIIIGTKKQKVGEEVHVTSGNNWGLTAAAAAFGWLVLSRSTKATVVDNYVWVNYVQIYLSGHPTDNEAIFLCNDGREALQIVHILRGIIEERRQYAKRYEEPDRLTLQIEQGIQRKVDEVAAKAAKEEKKKQVSEVIFYLFIASILFLIFVLIYTS